MPSRPASSLSLIPPGTGGVRDYAQTLGLPLVELTPTTDTSSLAGDILLLHFSGYGFHKRGVPQWLVSTMRGLHERFRSVGVVFHELFANGPPWGSAFWLNGWQRRIARELVLLADFWLTNREDAARWLLKQTRTAPHRVLPVFSNVGEPPWTDTVRAPRLVVFGSAGIRAQVYAWSGGAIFRWARQQRLEIHDIGPAQPDGTLARQMAHEGAIAHGRLPVEQVSRALSEASYGALAYPADFASKSGVFAAYCAHGVCPILLATEYGVHDGLTADVHYARGFEAFDGTRLDPRAIARAAHDWYQPHRIAAHVDALQALAAEARR